MPTADTATESPRRRALWPLAAGLAAFGIITGPIWNPALQLYYRDTARLYYPLKRYLAERLAHGQLPLWDPWTESGVSVLGQLSPGLLHPLTLLYLLLPFDLAFKLNHLLPLFLAGAGLYVLARDLQLSRWSALLGGIVFGGCGYLLSTAASNLPYVLGPATVPWAVWGLRRFARTGTPGSLLLGAWLLALCIYAGEPQSMLLAGLIGGVWVLADACVPGPSEGPTLTRRLARTGLRIALWGGLSLALAAPALVPVVPRLARSTRSRGFTDDYTRNNFSVHPRRLLGVIVPEAFDDNPTPAQGTRDLPPSIFLELLAQGGEASFADSITIGLPAVLLALLALGAGRRARLLGLGAVVLLLASAGDALGIYPLLEHVVPGMRLFRYAEKLTAFASMLIAVLAAVGADALLKSRRLNQALVALSGLSAAIAGGALWACSAGRESLEDSLRVAAATHDALAVRLFVDRLLSGLGTTVLLSAAMLLVSVIPLVLPARTRLVPALLAGVCFVTALVCTSNLLFTVSTRFYADRPGMADRLVAAAGESYDRWRVYVEPITSGKQINENDPRLAALLQIQASLMPQFDALARVQGINSYFSISDERYAKAVHAAAIPMIALLNGRFVVLGGYLRTPEKARRDGFRPDPDGFWIHDAPLRPRAFLVDGAIAADDDAVVHPWLASHETDLHREAVVTLADRAAVEGLPPRGTVGLPPVTWSRPDPEHIQIGTAAPRDTLLVVSEHFDAGWSAWIDGAPARVIETDRVALGLRIPAGAHQVTLRFRPAGLVPSAAGVVLLSGLLAFLHLRRRPGA
ncbi:MAG: YfhO family protein [Deltaproteobacteria bacterium]|nr:YfhO family protein [Deltaproteobacteria bacterium]